MEYKTNSMNNIKSVDIVLGCSYGDEGKGKVVYDLLKKNNYDICVRFNGSANAGHTIYHNGQKVVLHQLPIGILFENTINLISSDCLIDIDKLKEEIESVKKLGIFIHNKIYTRLYVSKACHIITKESIEFDKKNNLIGTTGSGIGPTYANKMLRIGKRVEDYEDILRELEIKVIDQRTEWFPFKTLTTALLEGAQGFELDINWTDHYPYCTSSTCTLAGAINTGIPIKSIKNIYGISKIYDTYVGTREFQPPNNEELNIIGTVGNEYGSTTGRRRQCNYLNLEKLIQALTINQCNICIMNKVDILETTQIFKLYHKNTLIQFLNMESMKKYIQKYIKINNMEVIFSSSPNEI
jgi:adenylosuccinate synthase